MSSHEPQIAVCQARLGSTRFPGKVLEPLDGRPLLAGVLERVSRAEGLDGLVLATSKSPTDDPLAAWCAAEGVACFRGSEADVLGRFVAAGRSAAAAGVVRINCDNPLIDPRYIDELLRRDRGGVDYLSYRLSDGRPVMKAAVSFFAEWVSMDALGRAAATIHDPFLREHVTLGIYQDPDAFEVRFLQVPAFSDDPDFRFTVDHPEDLRLLEELAEAAGVPFSELTAERAVETVRADPMWLERMTRTNARSPK